MLSEIAFHFRSCHDLTAPIYVFCSKNNLLCPEISQTLTSFPWFWQFYKARLNPWPCFPPRMLMRVTILWSVACVQALPSTTLWITMWRWALWIVY